MPSSYKVNHLLTELALLHRTAIEKALANIGLHGGQVSLLSELWKHERLTQADLVRHLGVSPPTVHKMISRLAKAGFVRSEKSSDDNRITIISLTSKGVEIRPEVEKVWSDFETLLLKDFTEIERLLAPMVLDKLKSNLIG